MTCQDGSQLGHCCIAPSQEKPRLEIYGDSLKKAVLEDEVSEVSFVVQLNSGQRCMNQHQGAVDYSVFEFDDSTLFT